MLVFSVPPLRFLVFEPLVVWLGGRPHICEGIHKPSKYTALLCALSTLGAAWHAVPPHSAGATERHRMRAGSKPRDTVNPRHGLPLSNRNGGGHKSFCGDANFAVARKKAVIELIFTVGLCLADLSTVRTTFCGEPATVYLCKIRGERVGPARSPFAGACGLTVLLPCCIGNGHLVGFNDVAFAAVAKVQRQVCTFTALLLSWFGRA